VRLLSPSCHHGINHPRRVDERRAGVDRDGHAQRLGDFLLRRAVILRGVDVRGDAAIALPRDADGNGDQFAGLCIEVRRPGAGIPELTVAANRRGSQPPKVADAPKQRLPIRPSRASFVTAFT
jgi:hypothetical protein